MVRLLRMILPSNCLLKDCFNPTMVRLLQIGKGGVKDASASFNPTMVRLLPCPELGIVAGTAPFQSHNGAIAAVTGRQRYLRRVSIPQWCDCCE